MSMYLIVWSVCVACDRPTAPEALDMALATRRQLEAGDLEAAAKLRTMLSAAPMLWTNFDNVKNPGDDFPVRAVIDSSARALSAFVVEVIYVPPLPHGKPFVERMFHAWPRDTSFGVFGVATAAISEPAPVRARRWGPREAEGPWAMVMVHYPRPVRPWVIDGETTIHIASAGIGQPCAWRARKVVEMGFRHADVKCQLAVYRVDMSGVFVAEADTGKAEDQRAALRHQLSAKAERVPGMRFTVRCPDVPISSVSTADADLQQVVGGCVDNPFKYWQDNSLFAAHLGVDIGSMKYRVQTLNFGSHTLYRDGGVAIGPPPFTESSQPKEPWLIRWTAYAPDGTVVRKDSVVTGTPPNNWGPAGAVIGLSPGIQRRLLVPESGFRYPPSDYGVVILDVEISRP
jgi:hypothetical protein